MSGRRDPFLRDERGGTAAEFAMVLPLLLIFLLGIIDAGRFAWTCNRAEKATQMGARAAVVTDIVPSGLSGYSFAISGGIPQGDPIPSSAFGGATCTSNGTAASCTCDGTCPSLGTASNTAFNYVVDRMQKFMPELQASQVQIQYAYSALGYAGNPNGIDVAPLVRVSLRQDAGHRPVFVPLTLMVFGANIDLPAFTSSLTLEDGSGASTPN